VSHGNAGNISNRIYLANALTRAGCSVLLYDYRGYGVSTGTPTITGILQDGLSVYDFAHDKLQYPAEKIILYGESIGTAVTCNIACNRQCEAVILQSGIGSLPSVGRHIFPILWLFPDSIVAEPHLDNVASVKTLHVPLLLCHGMVDNIVPFHESERMFASANQPKQLVLLPHCGHNDMGVYDTREFNDAICNFVAALK
jgi:pimeloyl-ACP methyl ester carboxylesterase